MGVPRSPGKVAARPSQVAAPSSREGQISLARWRGRVRTVGLHQGPLTQDLCLVPEARWLSKRIPLESFTHREAMICMSEA